jgi:protein-disulfide isomerase
MKLTNESKIFLGIIAISVVIIGIASVVLTKPAPTFTADEIMPKDTYAKGNPNAKVILVEFSDFQCPACLTAKPTIDAIFTKHKDKMIFAYRHFPLDQHPFARKAAQAAEAAGVQGKFWEMYDLLFANQLKFSETIFSDLAKQLSLDMNKFEEDMKSTALTNRVGNDQADGTRFGVNSTPSFFLNGKKLELSSFDDLTKAVDEAVANAK